MTSFALLSVLGSGSPKLACHHRFPLAAYQAGSILVIWDYTREDSRKFVLLQPNQRCSSIFFSKDAQVVLAFWLSQTGQPTLTAWRTADGTKLAEHRLSDAASGCPVWADFDVETQHFIFVQGSSVLSACVAFWDSRSFSPQHLAHGQIGSAPSEGLVAVRLVEDGRHFAVAESMVVHFWTYAGLQSPPLYVLRVDLGKPVKAFELQGRLAYLLPDKGKLQVMNFEGQREQMADVPPSSKPTALDVKTSAVCLGCGDGTLLLCRSASPDRWRPVACPAELLHGSTAPAVVAVCLGMNEDYACVCFADATHGVVHLESGRYVALRAGHGAPLKGIVMAPQLRAPSALTDRMLDAERALMSRALAFLTLSSKGAESDCHGVVPGAGFIAWPKQGPPARGFVDPVQTVPHGGLLMDSFLLRGSPPAAPAAGTGGCPVRLGLTAAAFHPAASLAADGSVAGAYSLLVGSEDGSVQLLTAEGSSADPGISWRASHVRPLPSDVQSCQILTEALPASEPDRLRVQQAQGTEYCCHLSFSRCGNFVLASFAGGGVELIQFPFLTRLLLLQPGLLENSRSRSSIAELQKAFFVWRPTVSQRAYDKNFYALARAESFQEVVLYEIYSMGQTYAKSSHAVFALPTLCLAAGGSITDFTAHPSQLYLVMAAVVPASDSRSLVLVYDLWSGELLKSCAVFNSLLVAPLLPLRPSLCIDASGSYIFCASTPTAVGTPEVHFPRDVRSGSGGRLPGDGLAGCSDLLQSAWTAPGVTAVAPPESASVVCILDFTSGEQCYQASIDASCLTLGSPWHDPCQLLVGARDGTISVWRPPESVTARIRSLLHESHKAYAELGDPPAQEDANMAGALSGGIEEAVAWHWATQLHGNINWSAWGDGLRQESLAPGQHPLAATARPFYGSDAQPLPLLPVLPPMQATRPGSQDDDGDVVLRARKLWAGGAPQMMQPAQPPQPQGPSQPLSSLLVPPSAAREKVRQPEIDPISGLEVLEMPGGQLSSEMLMGGNAASPSPAQLRAGGNAASPSPAQPAGLGGKALPAWQRPLEPAELLVEAPELREEFGTNAEHFQDPLPSQAPFAGPTPVSDAKHLPRWLEQGRPALRPGRPDVALVRSVFSELDNFEMANPDSQVPESPRSSAGEMEAAEPAAAATAWSAQVRLEED